MCVRPGPGQGQPPWMWNRLRDNLISSHRAASAKAHIGASAALLKARGKHFQTIGNLFQQIGIGA